jgi:MFS family permease
MTDKPNSEAFPAPAGPPPQPLTLTHWLIVIIASIGFAFDIYELLMLPLVVGPALLELINARPGSDQFNLWVGLLFFVPALAGGLFGLIGGYLTDRLGRRRVLVWSILLYAFSAFFAGFSTSPQMLLILRCTTFIGVCVEFVAAVAWLAELFPNPKQREAVLGYTQAFSSVGGLMVAGANLLAVQYGSSLPAIAIPEFLTGALGAVGPDHAHEAWRYTLMSGLIPALPLIIIRPFMPESPAWAEKKAAGTLKRASILELFRPEFRRTTIVTAVLFACSYGAAFGAIQHVPRMVGGLPEVKEQTAGQPAPRQREIVQKTAGYVQTVQEIGGLCGRVALAILAVRIVGRQTLLRLFQGPGLIVVPLVFAFAAVKSLPLLYVGIFLVGFLTVAQFSFWGNYLPRVYPVHLRGTGESFAANIGGRMVGTSFAWVTTSIASLNWVKGDGPPDAAGVVAPADPTVQLAYTAAVVGTFVYLVGLAVSFQLPEPRPETEHD